MVIVGEGIVDPFHRRPIMQSIFDSFFISFSFQKNHEKPKKIFRESYGMEKKRTYDSPHVLARMRCFRFLPTARKKRKLR
jgi:hypothetical protein